MSKVVVEGLVKRYGDFAAVDGIDLTIAEGELVVLLGPSGCGKTTTLRCVAGLEDVTSGRILMGDEVVSASGRSVPPERRAIGMVFQSYAVWPHMSVADNVAFGLKLKGLGRATIVERVRKVLALVGLEGFGERDISKLSGGQQQRVALARAIVLEPRVLLFDEPLSNLDAKLREHMRFEIRELQKRLGITAIYVTHDQQEAMVIADRIVLMNRGRIEQVGAPQDLYRRPASRFGAEFVGLANVVPAIAVRESCVRLADGTALACDTRGAASDTPVELMVRPENISVSASPLDGPNVLRGTVSRVYFLGNLADLYVQVAGRELRIQVSPPAIFPDGQQLWLRMPAETLLVFPLEKA